MDTNKFNTKLGSNSEPFAYVERETKITDKKNNDVIEVISFGALETHDHRAPEFGGVAIVHMNPDVFIGVKYIPWNAKGRKVEHDKMIQKLRTTNMNNQELCDFLYSDGYVLPAVKEKIRNDYRKEKLLNLAEEPKEIKKSTKRTEKEFYEGEEIIPLDE